MRRSRVLDGFLPNSVHLLEGSHSPSSIPYFTSKWALRQMVMSPKWRVDSSTSSPISPLACPKPTSSEAIFRLFKYPSSLTIQECGRGLGPCCIASQLAPSLSVFVFDTTKLLWLTAPRLRGSTHFEYSSWSQMNFTPLCLDGGEVISRWLEQQSPLLSPALYSRH